MRAGPGPILATHLLRWIACTTLAPEVCRVRILFVGGTSFVGRHMAEAAVARGHDITLFHRGRTGGELFPDAEHVLGDRDADLNVLAGQKWDAAIDVCGYVPRQIRTAAGVLGNAVELYCYVSSVSAFLPTGAEVIREDSPLYGERDLEDPSTEVIDEKTYGPLEALSEREATAGFPGRALIVRPTYVVGPYDPTDRFTYWVRRAAVGNEILVPGPPEAPAQLIDARDLGSFTIGLVERGETGPFLGVGPASSITFAEMVASCMESVGSEAMLVWADPARLTSLGVHIETELPLWHEPADYELCRCDPSTSIGAGLRFRPIAETVRDTLAWDQERGTPPLRGTLTPEREREVLHRLGF
jgi:nucleoside-diphosphate-sugar epimerase